MKTVCAAFVALALLAYPALSQETEEQEAQIEEVDESQAEEVDASDSDEVETSLSAALDAYRSGDLDIASEETDYARQLLTRMRADRLSSFLPEPMEGWSREGGESGGVPGLGGIAASATYLGPEDRNVQVQIMAENQMVASMMMLFDNPAMIGQMGELTRIGRQKAILTGQGELQAMLDNNILISVSGDAPVEAKQEYFERIDIEALQQF